jgi:hypothetical protein
VYIVDTTLHQHTDLQIVRNIGKLRNALPIRCVCAHVCYNDPLMVPIMSLSMFLMGTHTRLRFRAHYGSHEEVGCQLRSFGIPISALPVSPRGEFNLENHRTCMAMRRAIEVTKSKAEGQLGIAQKKKPKEKAASRQPITGEDVFVATPQPQHLNEPTGYGTLMGFSNNFGFMPSMTFANPWWGSVVGAPSLPSVVPTQRQLPMVPSHITGPTSVISDPLPNDILVGRGKPIQYRPANVRFREMLDKHMDKYDKGEKGTKVKVVSYIIHLVKEEGGRFLKELEDGGWVEVDEAAARVKISHSFRSRRAMFHSTLEKDKSTA